MRSVKLRCMYQDKIFVLEANADRIPDPRHKIKQTCLIILTAVM